MDLPRDLQSALGSTYRVERELGRGGMGTHPRILPYSDFQPLADEERR